MNFLVGQQVFPTESCRDVQFSPEQSRLPRRERQRKMLAAAGLLAAVGFCISANATAQAQITGWGAMVVDSPWHQENFAQLAGGFNHSLALRPNGSLVAWGENIYGQCNVPALPAGVTYVEFAGGRQHTLARRSDGQVVAFGDNFDGQLQVLVLPAGVNYSRSLPASPTASRRAATVRSSGGASTPTANSRSRSCPQVSPTSML